MRAALAGDGAAYRRLLTDLSPYLRNLCRKACARAGLAPSEAEDAVQETLSGHPSQASHLGPGAKPDAVDRRHRPQQDHRRRAPPRPPRGN